MRIIVRRGPNAFTRTKDEVDHMTPLAGWANFYVIVGSSAGALIGLQFVVLTLIAEIPIDRDAERIGAAFATPTIVHFGAALLLAAILDMPWNGVAGAAVLCGLLGLGGIVYQIIVTWQVRSQTIYKPELEDWLFHVLLPFLAYGTLAASAYATRLNVARALFAVGAAALLLVFIGIHNAWDTVTYHVFVRKQQQRQGEQRD